MNVTLFSFSWDGIHLATELDIVRKHIKNEDQTTVVICGRVVESCATNMEGCKITCDHCIGKRVLLFQSTGARVVLLSSYNATMLRIIHYKRDSNIVDVTYDGHEFGKMVASTYTSMSRKLEYSQKDYEVLSRLLDATVVVYEASRRAIIELKTDLAYVFNCRFVPIFGVVCAVRSLDVELMGHERGARSNMYALYPNADIHCPKRFVTECRAMFESDGLELAKMKAETFYTSRRGNRPLDGYCFTDRQVQNSLPDKFNLDDNNVAVFLSSDDEFYFLGDEWMDPVFGSQLIAFDSLVNSYHGAAKFWVRAHPNMANMDKLTTDRYRQLTNGKSNWTFIPPDHKASTYELIDNASKVISFGSTVGIEAAYSGKASILLGMAFYRDLGSTYTPTSMKDVLTMIDEPLKPLPDIGAIQYGSYVSSFGIEMADYISTGLYSGVYAGNSMNGYLSSNLAARVLSLLNTKSVLPKQINRSVKSFFDAIKVVEKKIRRSN